MVSLIRYDTQTFDIVFVNTVSDNTYQAHSILAISINEVIYSFKTNNSTTHHLVKASLTPPTDPTSDPDYSLDETYHKTISGDSTHGSISRLSHDNATLWHAVNLDNTVTYFQLNLDGFTLNGSARHLDSTINNGGLSMEVSEEVV